MQREKDSYFTLLKKENIHNPRLEELRTSIIGYFRTSDKIDTKEDKRYQMEMYYFLNEEIEVLKSWKVVPEDIVAQKEKEMNEALVTFNKLDCYKNQEQNTSTPRDDVAFILVVIGALLVFGMIIYFCWPLIKVILMIFFWPYFIFIDTPFPWSDEPGLLNLVAFIFFQLYMIAGVIYIFKR